MQRRLVVAVAQPAAARLALELSDRAEREVQDLERVPGAEGQEPGCLGVVVPRLDLDLGVRTVSDLLVGVEDRLLVAGVCRRREADGHALREEGLRRRGGAGSGASSPGRCRSAPGPLPARPSASRREATRTRPRRRGPPSRRRARRRRAAPSASPTRPAACRRPARAAAAGSPRARTARESRSSRRSSVVRRDHEVDAGVQVVGELRVDDVRLVAHEQGHHDPHRRS